MNVLKNQSVEMQDIAQILFLMLSIFGLTRKKKMYQNRRMCFLIKRWQSYQEWI